MLWLTEPEKPEDLGSVFPSAFSVAHPLGSTEAHGGFGGKAEYGWL